MEFCVEKACENMAVGNYLKKKKGFSQGLLAKIKSKNLLFVNDEAVWANYILKENDRVKVLFPESSSDSIIPQELNIEILFENEDVLVLNKPYNMPSHPSIGHMRGTLANFVKYHYEKNGIKSAVRILGRLDMNTTGVVVFCKNQHILVALSEAKCEKIYLAICNGTLEKKIGVIDLPIAYNVEKKKREVSENGKRAVTEYEVIGEKCGYSLVRLKLITGRTHQIRVHLSHLGHPLLGDRVYGSDTSFHRQALHAYKLITPDFTFVSPLSRDMRNFWDNLQINDLS